MSNFKSIFKKLDPTGKVFTEDVQAELETILNEKLSTVREEGMAKALEIANAKIKELDTDHAGKLKQVVEAVKTKYENMLVEMDTTHSTKIKQLFEEVDEDHANKLEAVIEAIDEDHSGKLKQVVEAIDADHAGKLDKIVKIYETKQSPDKIVEAVSDFMETYLEEVMPKATMINEARLNRLEKMYGTMKQLLVVNDEYVSTEVKEAVEDANSQISSKDKEIDKLMLEKVELKKKIGEIEADKMLTEKCTGFPPKVQAYLKARFKDASTSEMNEKAITEAVEAFKSEEDAQRKKILTESSDAKAKAKVKSPLIVEDTEHKVKAALKKEQEQKPEDDMSAYVGVLTKKSNTWKM